VHLVDGQPVVSATDLVGFLACEHLTNLERAALAHLVARPDREDPELDMIARRGTEHEQKYLGWLRDELGRTVAAISTTVPQGEAQGPMLRRAAEETLAALRRGDDVIYQATFFDGRWRGHADFLLRVERPSKLGAWSYEVADTKLARKAKAGALLQLCSYTEQLTRIQGVEPEQMHVVLGGAGMNSVPFRVKDYMAYYRAVKARFEASVFGAEPATYPPTATYPDPVEHCDVCRWNIACVQKRRHDDHLSLVAGLGRVQTKKLMAAGVPTVVALSQLPATTRIARLGQITLDRLREQARMQVEQRRTGVVDYELLRPIEPERGLAMIPEPSPGDLFFDLEGDPFATDEGIEYLWGVIDPMTLGADGKATFHHVWAHTQTEEKAAFEWFIDFVMARLQVDPGMHVYHYAPYEPTVVKRLMGRYGTREDEVDRLLRGGVFVDLYRVVRNGVRVSQESYSIKKLEPLYRLERAAELKDAGSSILAYEKWLESGPVGGRDETILEGIRLYNEDDCRSNHGLRGWLEGRRLEVAERDGVEVPRPVVGSPEPTPALSEFAARAEELAAALTAGVPEERAERSDDQHARWLLAQLLQWHRREDKAEWWHYFYLRALSDEELVDEPDAIGGLTPIGPVGEPEKRAQVFRYTFDPSQEYKIAVGDTPDDPRAKSAGKVMALDAAAGTIDLRRQLAWDTPHPTALVPPGPLETIQQRNALMRLGEWVRDHGLEDSGDNNAAIDLLRGLAPRVAGIDQGSGQALMIEGLSQLESAKQIGLRLDGSTLAIQGPPGSGKTFTGARMILELVRAGRTVGITAQSHKVIGNMLDEVCEAAPEGLAIRAMQKADEADRCNAQIVECVGDNKDVLRALAAGEIDIAAGTSWMWSRADFVGTVDTLFVDEAGQMSLANVLAMAGAARNIVLLGDPQQLNQPVKGSHPPGAEKSALEHLLGSNQTIPPDRGLFLAQTWRMHPDICRYTSEVFYDDRLDPEPTLVRQSVRSGGGLSGTGIRFMEVPHSGNRNASVEEVRVVDSAVRELLAGGVWTDRFGVTMPLTLEDILVVAPYNTQVRLLREALPPGARVGTVDKFQGQEAPVVFYSMATSSAEEAPRGMEFLYSMNRLNVATSRARALSVIVCSPMLLKVRCHSPGQMRLANALARFVELAGGNEAPLSPAVAEQLALSFG
jgi:predicted RecB family nuclease